jgi:hypothetical protein
VPLTVRERPAVNERGASKLINRETNRKSPGRSSPASDQAEPHRNPPQK